MKADITRSTYNKNKKYVKVNAQQGRIQVDADWNEQLDIQEHFNKIMLNDLVGKTGTPFEESGFKIKPKNHGTTDFTIGKGRYYVDGLICENNTDTDASKQEGLSHPYPPLFTKNPIPPKDLGAYVVYLDVWQRHITSLEDPTLLEVALGQTDTTTRTKNIWQVKTLKLPNLSKDPLTEFKTAISQHDLKQPVGTLRVRVDSAQNYSGDENSLYRIEIHESGTISDSQNPSEGPVFKWSRGNAIVAAKILDVKVSNETDFYDVLSIEIENRGKGDLYTFRKGQWIEVTDEYCELWNVSGQIFEIENDTVNREANQVIDIKVKSKNSLLHHIAQDSYDYILNIPKVRLWNIPEDKWNMDDNVLLSSQTKPCISLSTDELGQQVTTSGYKIDDEGYITLEDGIQLKFEPGTYTAGDYWLIPARTITKNIEWPTNPTNNTPEASPSLMKHHYCPLALLNIESIEGAENIVVRVVSDYRNLFSTSTDNTLSFYSVSGDGQKITPKNVFYPDRTTKEVPLVLRVGVKMGNKPITPELEDKFQVRFKIISHEDAVAVGSLRELDSTGSGEDTFDASLKDGFASCDWIFLSDNDWTYAEANRVTRGGQRVSATLMFKPEDSSLWVEYLSAPIFFNATFAEPELCYVSGDGQNVRSENLVGMPVPVDLEARVVIGGEPYSSTFSKLWRAMVQFKAVKGAGTLNDGNSPILPDDNGVVSCPWKLGDNILHQQVTAELVDLGPSNGVFGSALYFNATLSQPSAENVLSFYAVSGDSQKITPKNVYLDSSTRGVPLVLCVGAKMGDSLITGELQDRFFVRFDVIKEEAINEGVSELVHADVTLGKPFVDVIKEGADVTLGKPFVDVIKEGADVTLGKPFVDVIKEGADVTLGKPFVDVIKEEDNNESVSKLVHADGELKNSFDADFVNGVASCNWVFCPNEGWHKGDGNKVSPNRQVVRATLMMHTGSTGNSDAECLVAPIFFNATFAEPELRYVKGNGAVSNFDADYDLSARLFVGEEPLTYSVANLWRVNVRWTSTANVPLFYNDASDAGGYILCVIAFKGTFPEGIIHVNSEMVNFNKKAFGLTISFTITCLTTPISGVVKLDFPPNSNECGPLLAGPIYHEIFSTTPPAIMLSLIPAENSSTPLDFYYRPPGSSKPNLSVVNAFEDFCLYNNANPPGNNYIPPRFKVCTVDTEKFWVWVEPPYYSGNCYLRWWAIPASASKNNNGDSNGYLPVKMGPLINVTNLGGDPINTIFFNEPFKVGIVNTFTENENLKINIVINARDNPVFDAWITLPPKVSSIGEWILPINLTPSTITVKAEDETPLHTTQFPHSVSKLFQNLSMSTGYSCNLIISFNPTRPLNNLGCITRVLSIRRSLLAFSPVDVWDYP